MNLNKTVYLLVMTAMLVSLASCAPAATPAPVEPTAAPAQAATEAPAATAAPAATEAPAATVAPDAPVTLKVWDDFTRPEEMAIMDRLVQKFQAENPNVTVTREAKTMDDLKTTTALALKGDDGPDVVMVNQGESDMGALVKAGLLLPMNDYADKYGWLKTFPASQVRLNSWTADGSKMGEGNFYGIPIQSELVGVYYRKDLFTKYNIAVPTTFDEFQAAIDTLKKNGETPITFGNLDKWPAIHIFSELQNTYQGQRDWFDNFMFTTGKVDFNTPENLQAATTLQNWAKDGDFMKNFSGVGYDDSWGLFASGQGAMLITGSWVSGDLKASPNAANIGFFMVPPMKADGFKMTVGGTSFAFAINAKTKQADLAADYINYMYSAETAKDLLDVGYLPVYPIDSSSLPDGLVKDLLTSWTAMNTNNAVGYYMDWVTPTMYNTICDSLQELLGSKITPQEFIDKVNTDYTTSLTSKGITITK